MPWHEEALVPAASEVLTLPLQAGSSFFGGMDSLLELLKLAGTNLVCWDQLGHQAAAKVNAAHGRAVPPGFLSHKVQ
jgi:hypothetical protein